MANLPSSSLTDLHDEMVRGSIKLEIPVKKEPETSWSLPARVHFIWIGPTVIKDKYVNNINNFCQHNPDYEVWKFESFKSALLSQVILWLERNDSISQLSSTVERRDVNAVINASENEAIFRQISRVVIKADLLRYEVFLQYPYRFPFKLPP